jgi:hypothetical protein
MSAAFGTLVLAGLDDTTDSSDGAKPDLPF